MTEFQITEFQLIQGILLLLVSIIGILVWSIARFVYRRKIDRLERQLHEKYRQLIADPDANLQHAIHAWHRLNFPQDDARDALFGVGEELGEVMRAQIKQSGGIRGSWDYWQEEKEKEIGDVMIGLINYAAWNDIDWLDALQQRWATISRRDYIKYPVDGGRENE